MAMEQPLASGRAIIAQFANLWEQIVQIPTYTSASGEDLQVAYMGPLQYPPQQPQPTATHDGLFNENPFPHLPAESCAAQTLGTTEALLIRPHQRLYRGGGVTIAIK